MISLKEIIHWEPYRVPSVRRLEVVEIVSNSYYITPIYVLLILCSSQIALLGLLTNSTAVIIGAMLVSPLMDPLLGSALALARFERRDIWRSGFVILFSLLVVGVGVLVVMRFSPLQEVTPEILARTRPTLFDLLVALFAALAGTWSIVRAPVSNTIPGVAIATALMPPLVTAFFGVSIGSGKVAAGAAGLFLTNLATIIFSAILVFWLVGFRPQLADKRTSLMVMVRQLGVFTLVMLILAIPLGRSLLALGHETRVQLVVRAEMGRLVAAQPEDMVLARVDQTVTEDGGRKVEATVNTPQTITRRRIDKWEEQLSDVSGAPVVLTLYQIPLLEEKESAPVVAAPPPPSPEAARKNAFNEMVTVRDEIQGNLAEVLGEAEACLRLTLEFGESEGVTCLLPEPREFSQAMNARLRKALSPSRGRLRYLRFVAKRTDWPVMSITALSESLSLDCHPLEKELAMGASLELWRGPGIRAEVFDSLTFGLSSCGFSAAAIRVLPGTVSNSLAITAKVPKDWELVLPLN